MSDNRATLCALALAVAVAAVLVWVGEVGHAVGLVAAVALVLGVSAVGARR